MKDQDLQIKSRSRVTNFAEVNTSEREVNSMLDLVSNETVRLDSRFLEPACGDGNFLSKVLEIKVNVLVNKYKKSQYDFEKNGILAVGSIYGIDILFDNVQLCKDRLYKIIIDKYENLFGKVKNQNFIKSIEFILNKNIIHGDALTLNKVNSKSPIIFSEWGLVNNKIKRRDFTLAMLLAYAPFQKDSLFSDLGDEINLPEPIKEFPLLKFDRIFEVVG